jgi:hypothetical protein
MFKGKNGNNLLAKYFENDADAARMAKRRRERALFRKLLIGNMPFE